MWFETYDRTLDNIFAIQDEIAAKVVAQLKINLLGDVPRALVANPEAYTLFLQGRHLSRQKSAGTLAQAQALLQQALVIDPAYAAAWDELGSLYTIKDPGLAEIPNERLFSNIHDDPRWLPFLERIGKSPLQLNAIEFKVTLPR